MPKIDESDLDVGNEPPFVARKVVIKKGQDPKLDYNFSDELGRGRFGTVVKCTEKKTGLKLAAKFVSARMREERENVEREVDIMRSLQHGRLLQLYDVYDDGSSEMCIITELINGGELFERVIDDDFELTEKVCAIFMRQIIEGVAYMHDNYIMHLDMKPENILCVTRTGNRIKLIDFGLARRFDPKQKLQVMFGTPDFAAPEVLSYERVTPAADMWSLGVICYVLLSGLSPFMGNSDLETMTNVTRAIYDFDDESFEPISEEAKDFIAKLLIKEPTKRMKPNECLQHKWLAQMGAKRGKTQQLDKTKLKKYVVRRRWQKAVTAIMALTRMGANLSLTSPRVTARRNSVLSVSPAAQQQQQSRSTHKTTTTTTSSATTSNLGAAKTSRSAPSVITTSSLTSSGRSSPSSRVSSTSSSLTSKTLGSTSSISARPTATATTPASRISSTISSSTTSSRTASTKPITTTTFSSPVASTNRTFATSSSSSSSSSSSNHWTHTTSSMSTSRRKY